MSDDESVAAAVKRLAAGERLDQSKAAAVFAAMMEGNVSPVHCAAILTAMAVRTPSVDEIAGGAKALRAHMVTIKAPSDAIDLVGTGGDGLGTLNVSTAAALTVAACGVPVAKHGNRAMSSRTGAADVLESLGVKIGGTAKEAEHCLQKAGICFLFAQAHHPAMRHVGPIRKELGFRTIFNLLGPLSNPAEVKRQLLGVYAADIMEPLARTLLALGTEKAWVVHGSDGLDEITITGPTKVTALEDGTMRNFIVSPESAGLDIAPLSAVKGGEPEENAKALRALLDGKKDAFHDIVVLNAAAALVIAGKEGDLQPAAIRAKDALQSGAAKATLEKLAAASNEAAP